MTKKALIVVLIAVVLTACVSVTGTYFLVRGNERKGNAEQRLELFTGLTGGTRKLLYDWQKGELHQFPENVKQSISAIAAESNADAYYALRANGYGGIYDSYSTDSQYAEDVRSTVKEADDIMSLLQTTGVVDSIGARGKKPAIMFDIDNTLEFTSRADDDPKGDGPPIQSTVDFVKRWSRKGIECYFVTARDHNKVEAEATRKWLMNTFGLSEGELEKRVSLMDDVKYSKVPPNTKIAYKDAVRQAFSERDGLIWLMSMGDQLTDVYAKHSGTKVLLPNLLFYSAIVPNHFDNPSNARTQVIEPSRECYLELKDTLLQETSIGSALESQ